MKAEVYAVDRDGNDVTSEAFGLRLEPGEAIAQDEVPAERLKEISARYCNRGVMFVADFTEKRLGCPRICGRCAFLDGKLAFSSQEAGAEPWCAKRFLTDAGFFRWAREEKPAKAIMKRIREKEGA